MTILAIDPGLKTGWCIGANDHGAEDFNTKNRESPGMRYFHFSAWLDKVLALRKPDMVLYEAPGFSRGGAASEVAGGMVTRIQERAAVAGIEYTSVKPTELKRWMTGCGAGKKALMGPSLEARGVSCKGWSDDEIDAYCLWLYGQELWGGK